MPFFHVWFATKGRKWLLQGEILEAARELLQQIAIEKQIQLIESEAIVDHVHLLLELPDKSALPRAMMLLKGIFCPSSWSASRQYAWMLIQKASGRLDTAPSWCHPTPLLPQNVTSRPNGIDSNPMIASGHA